jgi:hypothetical protein
MGDAADHRQAFTAAMAALLADFNAYLDRDDARPFRDEVSYRQFVVWLAPAERPAGYAASPSVRSLCAGLSDSTAALVNNHSLRDLR